MKTKKEEQKNGFFDIDYLAQYMAYNYYNDMKKYQKMYKIIDYLVKEEFIESNYSYFIRSLEHIIMHDA